MNESANLQRFSLPGVCLTGWVLFVAVLTPAVGADFGSENLYFAQAVANAGSQTLLSIHNPADSGSLNVRADFFTPDGVLSQSRSADVGAMGTSSISFGTNDAELARGWIHLSSSAPFIATEFIDLFVVGPLPRIGVLPSSPVESARLSGFINASRRSGVALANPDPVNAANITARLRGTSGTPVGDPIQFALQPLEQRAAFLNEELLFGTDLRDFEGTVEISAAPNKVILTSLLQDLDSGNVATVAAFGPNEEAAPGFSGYERVVATFELVDEPRFATRYFSLYCPTGKSVLGGGASFSNATASNALTLAKSAPLFEQGWKAEFQVPAEYAGDTLSANIQLFALCAPVRP
ncbi:MAG: hypothetical protein WAO20_23075 [Acidobacteriota bacterium]